MSSIELFGKKFIPYLSAADIAAQVKRLGTEISKDYEEKNPLFIAILNGSFMFASDLFKTLTCAPEICFIKLASYKGTRSTGNVITSIGLDESLKGRHVIVLEDIVDTGKTLSEFLPQLSDQQPASIKLVALLHKPEALQHPIKIDYLGFSVPNKFLLGYGLDFDGQARNLPEIYQLEGQE